MECTSLKVRDVHLRGGSPFVYFLSIARSQPHFTLFADTDKTPLTPGTSGVIYVRTEKKNGFDGEIQLAVSGLPKGVTATCGKILSGKRQDGCIVLTAAARCLNRPSATSPSPERRQLVRTNRRQSISANAIVYQETYQPGGGRGHWPVAGHVVSVGTPGDVRKVTLSNDDIRLKPGETTSIDVEIERAEGFDKNVTLEVVYMHLSTIYGDPLPEGVAIDKSSSTVLLTGGATKGKITLKAAPQRSARRKTTLHCHGERFPSTFVMKATYASGPAFVTVAP